MKLVHPSGNAEFSTVESSTDKSFTAKLNSAKDGSEINKQVVPIIFGRVLIDPYAGFQQYTVQPGDTLFAIAQNFSANGSLYPRIFEANTNQLTDPNLIFPGQVLRVPL